MIIGFDAKRAFLNRSGLGNYSRDLIRSLHDLYPENTYILFSTSKESRLLETDYRGNLITPTGLCSISGSCWRSFRMGSSINKLNPDIFHGLSNELPFDIQRSRTKKVITIHDLIFMRYPELYPAIDRSVYRYKTAFSCRNADLVIATSEQTKSDLIEFLNVSEDKIEVIYQTCNRAFSRKINPEQGESIRKKYHLPEKYLLSVGTIEKRKNILNALKALALVKTNIPYVIVGKKTGYFSILEEWCAKNDMAQRVIFLHDVETDDLPAIYQMADIFIYPSLYEGFGIPVLEAFNSVVPVITSASGSTGEIAADAALKVNVSDPESIAEAVKTLLSSPETANELRKRAIERSKLFDRESVTSKLIRCYKNLLLTGGG